MPSNFKVSSDIDTFLRKQTREEAADYLGLELPPVVWGQVTGTLSNQTDLQGALDAKAPILDATFTGTTTIPSADITTADFNAGGLGGEVSWNAGEKTLDLVTGANGTTIQLGQEVVLYCRNKTATDLVDGQVVKIVGATANTPNIELAIASTTDEAHKTFGVVTQTIPANNGEGFITLMGKVRDLSLRTQDGFVEGELVYLSPTVAGALTPTKPLIEVEIGRVLRTGTNNGTLGVSINNEASVYELQQSVPHNTDSVIICNQGDNIQDKYDEAALLTPNGNPLDTNNQASLIVMGGTYSDLDISNINDVTYISIIGIGKVDLVVFGGGQSQSHYGDFKNFQCESFSLHQSMGTIENITVIPQGTDFEVATNAGTIRNVSSPHITINTNTGTLENIITTGQWYQDTNSGEIKNCSAAEMLEYSDNSGIIDNCHSTGTLTRAFFAYAGYQNSGTVKNCTSKGARSFGEQTATGVTENCTAVLQGFGATSSQIAPFAGSGGGNGTYKNCTGGIGSFFGVNTDTINIRVMLANYIDCTAQQQSFGYCNTSGAVTVFSGTAKNCTAGFRSFAGVDAGNAQISTGAIIENCNAGNFSFASDSPNTINFGIILRCRTTSMSANAFRVDGSFGKVRLCLDGNYNEVNLG